MGMPIFSNYKFYLSPSFERNKIQQLVNLLRAHGGTITNSHSRGCIYVIDKFEGEEFQFLRTQQGVTVISTNYVGELIAQHKAMPAVLNDNLSHFLMSTCLDGLVICSTGIDRAEIIFKACALGANFSRDFRKSATHLLAVSVGSQKYYSACNVGCPVIHPDWIHACWDALSRVDAERFRVPPFAGLRMSITGLRGSERRELCELANKNGASCVTDLEPKMDFLISKVAEGRKYQAAIAWNIRTVTPDWVFQSVKHGVTQDPAAFRVPTLEGAELMDSELPRTSSWSKISFIGATPSGDESNSSIASIGSIGSTGSVGSVGSNGSVGKRNNISISSSTDSVKNIGNNSNSDSRNNSKEPQQQLVRTLSGDTEIASSCLPDTKKRTIDMDDQSVSKRPKSDISYSPFRIDSLFRGLLFMCVGFDEPQFLSLNQYIGRLGGKCVRDDNIPTPTSPTLSGVKYIILQTNHTPPQTIHDSRVPYPPYVTYNWIDACAQQERVIDPCHPLHTPLKYKTPFADMRTVWACLSGFAIPEREYHRHLLRLLGAKFTDTFSKKQTHLICNEASGEKFACAKRWGTAFCLPIDWLFECAKQGKRVSEIPYLLCPLTDLQVNEITQRLHLKRKQTEPSQSQIGSATSASQALTVIPQHKDNELPHGIIKPERESEDVNTRKNNNNYNVNNNQNRQTTNFDDAPLEDQQIFVGITIVVASEDMQLVTSCRDMVQQLGGEFEWEIKGSGITHCLYEVKDKRAKVDRKIAELYNKAKADSNIKIVSPMWLKACFDSKCYVSESDYPPTLHPRKSLGLEKDTNKPLPPPPMIAQRIPLAPRTKRKIDFPDDTPDVSTPLSTKRPLSPPSSLLALTPIPHNSQFSLSSINTPPSLPSRSSVPYRSTPFVRSASPPPAPPPPPPVSTALAPPLSLSGSTPPPNDDESSPILQAVDPNEKDQSGYDGETSNFDKTANDADVSQMQTEANEDKDMTENTEETKENDDIGFKVLTERIKLLQQAGAVSRPFLPPPPLSPPKKLKKSKSSKLSRALLESEDIAHGNTPKKPDHESQNEKNEDKDESTHDSTSQLHLHYSHNSYHASDDDAGSVCSQVVTYDDTSVTAKMSLLELAASRSAETTDRENMRKELAGLLKATEIKPPQKPKIAGKRQEPVEVYVLPPPPKPRTFTLTGFRDNDKNDMKNVIEGLGGYVVNDFQPLVTTHVIADKPTQSEKYMSGCAAGVWVIHALYLRACGRAGEWLDEAPYEWSPENYGNKVDPKMKHWIDAPIRCRLEIERYKRDSGESINIGMFRGMAFLMWNEAGAQQIGRLLEAGSAKVKICKSVDEITPAYVSEFTHSFTRKISDQTKAFCTAVAKFGVPHLILSDIESILLSGRAGPPRATHPQSISYQSTKKPTIENEQENKVNNNINTTKQTTSTTSATERPVSPKRKKSSPPTKPPPQKSVSPKRNVSPAKRSVSPQKPRAKVESPAKSRGKESSKPKPINGEECYNFDDSDPPKSARKSLTSRRKK